jgi:lipoprotein-releasing system permease protein
MFNKLTWFIAYKYLTTKHENGFISFIAGISVIGVALGIAVLIIVLSVMDGFREHIESNMLTDKHHLTVNLHDTTNITDIISKVKAEDNNIIQALPIVLEQGILKIKGNIIPIYIAGLPPLDNSIKSKNAKVVNQNNIQISRNLALNYNLSIGDKLILAAPILKDSVLGPQPRFKKFVVSGMIAQDNAYATVQADIIMSYSTALKFFDYSDNYITGLYLYSNKPMLSEQMKSKLHNSNIFDAETKIITWQEENQNLFQAIRLERISILLIIITVACFNILSGLYIQVSEKHTDIAILRTLGMNKQQISSIFILQGILIALLGGFFGILLGSFITEYLDSMVFWLQQFGIINQNNNFFNAIASNLINIKINYFEITSVFFLSLILCLLATIIPAIKSSKITPIEALRNE